MRWIILSYFCMLAVTERSAQAIATFKADLSFPHYETGYKTTPNHKRLFTYVDLSQSDDPIPDSYDLRPKISTIQNQKSCGSCWAFSLTAALQDALILYGKDPGDLLSQQYLVDCAKDMYGCGGGTFEAANWLSAPKGAPLLKDYPYTARNGRCQSKQVAGSLLEWHYVGSSSRKPTTAEIQHAILQYGEVSVTVGADNSLMSYKSGIYNACTGTGVNHMVDLVGWNNEGAIPDSNGSYPAGKGYWIMRNSWGTGWGEQGWGNIRYTSRSGRKCNNLADEAIFVKVVDKPLPPVPKEFAMESQNLTLKVTLSKDYKLTINDAKKVLQVTLDNLDRP